MRQALGIAPATMSDLLRRICDSEQSKPRQGSVRRLSPIEARTLLGSRGYTYPEPAKVISFLMCKGGVGKTTSSLFVAQRMSAYGARVLAIDADMQSNLTSAFDLEGLNFTLGSDTSILATILRGECSFSDAIIPITENLDLLPSTPINALLEGTIRERFKNTSRAMSFIDELRADYDFILIDCAPALSLTNTAIACVSDLVVLPVAPDRFSQIGLDQTLKELAQIEKDFAATKSEKRILFTRYDGREFTSLKYLTEVAEAHPEKRFSTAIRTSADVKNVIARREDLFQIRKSNARDDYDAFTRELMGIEKVISNRKTTRGEQPEAVA
jgi:chromosome partitioning protein